MEGWNQPVLAIVAHANKRLQLAVRGSRFAAALTGGRPRSGAVQSGFAAGRRSVYGRRTAGGS
jgi:hypothetical protein